MSIDPSDKPIYTLSHLLRDLEAGRRFHADASRMTGIDRLEVLCDKAFKGTGLTIANVRQIRADLCEEMHCSLQVAGDFSLPDVVNALTGVTRWSLPELFNALRGANSQLLTSVWSASALSPATTWDTLCDLNLDVHRADCRIVKGTDPSVCPKADPPLPAEYLPVVVEVFNEFNQIPSGHTIHWIGLKAWCRNLCECFPVKASEAGGDQGGAGQGEGDKPGNKPPAVAGQPSHGRPAEGCTYPYPSARSAGPFQRVGIMSLDAVKRALAALLLPKLLTPAGAKGKDELLEQLQAEGHRRSDIEAGLFEMETAQLVRTEEIQECHYSDSPLAQIPDDVFLTGNQWNKPLEVRFDVVRPLPALRDWWKEQPASPPERVIEIPLGESEGVEETAKEQEPSARSDQGKPGNKPPEDEFTQLREFARDQLKGKERAVIEALCASKGEMPVADLAVKPDVDWTNPEEGFRNAQSRLNPKLKKHGWTLARQNNAAKLNPRRS